MKDLQFDVQSGEKNDNDYDSMGASFPQEAKTEAPLSSIRASNDSLDFLDDSNRIHFIACYLDIWKNCFKYKVRTRRREYICALLMICLITVITCVCTGLFISNDRAVGLYGFLCLAIHFVPSIALVIRRFNDALGLLCMVNEKPKSIGISIILPLAMGTIICTICALVFYPLPNIVSGLLLLPALSWIFVLFALIFIPSKNKNYDTLPFTGYKYDNHNIIENHINSSL